MNTWDLLCTSSSKTSHSCRTMSQVAELHQTETEPEDHVDDENPSKWENLPDPVLLAVFALLDIDHLQSVAGCVCMKWRYIAQSPSLWKNKQLTFLPWDIWDDEENAALKFSSTFKFAPCLQSLELGLMKDTPLSIVSALQESECQLNSLTLSVQEYNPVAESFLDKHKEVVELTVIDQCCSSAWAHRICNKISCMQLTSLNLNRSQLLHHKGVQLQGLHLHRLEYYPSELTDEIADPQLVLAELIRSSQQSLRSVFLRAPYNEVFSALVGCTCLEEVDLTYGEGIMKFLKALTTTAVLKSLQLCDIPESSESLAKELASLQHLQNLKLVNYQNFPGFPALLPMISSVKTLELSRVKYIGGNDLKNLLAMRSVALKEIVFSDCPCSATASYRLCRDRALTDLSRCGIKVTVFNADEMDDNFDCGYKPVYDCKCDRRKPR